MSYQAEPVSHEHIPGSYFSVLSPQTCLSFTHGCGDGCMCTDVSVCSSGPQLALGRLRPSCSLRCFTHPPQLLSPSAQNFSEKIILSLVCSPEKLPCFFLCGSLGFSLFQTSIAWIWAGPRSERLQDGALLPCCWQGVACGVFVPGPEEPPQDAGSGWRGLPRPQRAEPP